MISLLKSPAFASITSLKQRINLEYTLTAGNRTALHALELRNFQTPIGANYPSSSGVISLHTGSIYHQQQTHSINVTFVFIAKMSSWIKFTPRLQQGLDIVSELDNGKFRQLVNRVCQGLHSGVNDKIFTAEEEEKLMLSLNLNKDTLGLLLDTITYIYSQAAFSVVKPAVMESVMKETFSIAEEKVSIIVNTWTFHAKRIIDALRQESIFPRQLEDVNWSFNVHVASHAVDVKPKPKVLLQLGMTGRKRERVTIEMDRSSVAELYNNLEKIQSQLDALK